MGQLVRSVMVDASQGEVFALLAAPKRFGEWVAGFAGLDDGPERLGDGAAFRWRVKLYGVTLKPRSTIVAFDEPRSYEETIRLPGIVRATLTKVATQEKRRTQLRWVLDYRFAGGPLGVALDWALGHRLIARAVERSLANAKRVLEAPKQAPDRSLFRRQTAVR